MPDIPPLRGDAGSIRLYEYLVIVVLILLAIFSVAFALSSASDCHSSPVTIAPIVKSR